VSKGGCEEFKSLRTRHLPHICCELSYGSVRFVAESWNKSTLPEIIFGRSLYRECPRDCCSGPSMEQAVCENAPRAERVDFRRNKPTVSWHWMAGAVICTGAAAMMTAIFSDRSGREMLPLVFLAVITLVAVYFGVVAGVIGSLAAAVIFSIFLFPPLGSPIVNDISERANVGWMLLGGLALSYLFAPHPPGNPPRQQ